MLMVLKSHLYYFIQVTQPALIGKMCKKKSKIDHKNQQLRERERACQERAPFIFAKFVH